MHIVIVSLCGLFNMFCCSLNLSLSLLFQLKELEKMGPKKGVISQSVKDVVQSLVDDDLVLRDKIGTSVSSSAYMFV